MNCAESMDLSDHALGQPTTTNKLKSSFNKPRHFRIPFCKNTLSQRTLGLRLSGYHLRYKKYNVAPGGTVRCLTEPGVRWQSRKNKHRSAAFQWVQEMKSTQRKHRGTAPISSIRLRKSGEFTICYQKRAQKYAPLSSCPEPSC